MLMTVQQQQNAEFQSERSKCCGPCCSLNVAFLMVQACMVLSPHMGKFLFCVTVHLTSISPCLQKQTPLSFLFWEEETQKRKLLAQSEPCLNSILLPDSVSCMIDLVCPEQCKQPAPAHSWHCLSWFTASAALLCLCEFSDHLKKQRAGWCLCLFLRASLRSRRDLQTAELRGGDAGGRGREGSVRMLGVVGISSSSPAWTPEPQCGVPVHILKHYDCLVFAVFCLFLPAFPPSPPHNPSHLLLLMSALLPLFLSPCLSRGSYIT